MSDSGREFWERTARRYDLSMKVLGGPLPAMMPLVRDEVAGLDRVLELASGTGLVTGAIASVATVVVATDYAEAMVEALQHRVSREGWTHVTTAQLDVYSLDDDVLYDGIVAANVLHLLPDLSMALERMVAALRPGGRLVVPTYCHNETWASRATSQVMGVAGFPGQRRLTLRGLETLLTEAGLRVRRSVLLPGLLPIGFVSAERG